MASGRRDEGRPGTRFRLFPQPPFLEGFEEPETVWVSPPAGSIGPGPSDDRMYAVNAIGKSVPYGTSLPPQGDLYLPPWGGPARPPAMPDEQGHFDHIETWTPQFEAAHVYGVARFVLDIWEGYFGRHIPWHFRQFFERMELSILPDLNNATMGYGFMELGGYTTERGEYRPFTLNFDIVAHEIGHSIVYQEVGLPAPRAGEGEYYGFHESAADLVALLSSLHFQSVIDDIMRSTRGNLYALNKLNRMGELSRFEQIRSAANADTLLEFEQGWRDEHALAQPLTGAIFDIFVDIFHEQLLDRGLISPALEALSDRLEDHPDQEPILQARFDDEYQAAPDGFVQALIDTRDHMGLYLAEMLRLLSPDGLSYVDVRDSLVSVDRLATGGRYEHIVNGNLAWRGVGCVEVGPRRGPAAPDSHADSVRTAVPRSPLDGRRQSYLRRWLAASAPDRAMHVP